MLLRHQGSHRACGKRFFDAIEVEAVKKKLPIQKIAETSWLLSLAYDANKSSDKINSNKSQTEYVSYGNVL